MHTSLLLVFIDVFCMYVDFNTFPFRQLNSGPLALPADDRQQCHPNVGQYVKVDTKVISHYQINSLILILIKINLDVLHTSMAGGAHVVAKALVIRGMFKAW